MSTIDLIKNKKLIIDAFSNVLTGFGTLDKDPIYKMGIEIESSLSKADVEILYKQDWATKKIIDIYPEDATREWVDINAPDEKIVVDLNTKIENLNIQNKVEEALCLARLYGGSLVILGAIDNRSPEQELDINSLEDIAFINVVDRWGFDIREYYQDPFSGKYGEPKSYVINTQMKEPNKIYDTIHESRVIRFDGAYLPEYLRRMNNGWHDTILNGINTTLRQYSIGLQSGAVLFTDFITKVLKMPNLFELLQTDEGKLALEGRIQYAISRLSSLGMVLIGEDESYDKVQTPITGLTNLINIYIELLAGAARYPRSRFFGQSLGTLAGATETTRAYYDDVASYQNKKMKNQLKYLLKLLLNCKSSITNGIEPNNWSFKFRSLWKETDKEVTTARKMQSQVDEAYISNQVLTPEEVKRNRFRSDGYSFDTFLSDNK